MKRCYEDIAKPYCQDLISPPIDVGEEECSKYKPSVTGGSAGCDGDGLVCCQAPNVTDVTCGNVDGPESFSTNRLKLLSVLLLAQCRPEDVPVPEGILQL